MKSYFTLETSQKILKYAAVFHALMGLILIFFPAILFNLLTLSPPENVDLWQAVGVGITIIGGGYYLASLDPEEHWSMILVGLFLNVFPLLVFIKSFLIGHLSFQGLFLFLLNNLLWIALFYNILLCLYTAKTLEESEPKKFHDLIKFVRTSNGETLYELSQRNNTLLIFVRHFGCTFCRETVSEIAKLEESILKRELIPVFVHMSDPSFADDFFARYYSHPVAHVSDPGRLLYKSLNLKRGNFYQIFGPRTWFHGLWSAIFKGHGLGASEGDVLQLGGVFVLSKGQILFEYKSQSASDIFDQDLLPHS